MGVVIIQSQLSRSWQNSAFGTPGPWRGQHPTARVI